MFSLSVLVLTLLVSAVQVQASSCSSGSVNHNYELSGQALTDLYNSPVYLAERVFRPMGSCSSILGSLSHSGVRVTLRDGSQWLVHKGNDYGRSSQTVVVNARHMSSRWETRETKDFGGTKTVADLVKTGGATYNLVTHNCHKASSCMMNPDQWFCN